MTGVSPAELPANVRVGAGCHIADRRSFDAFRSARDPGLVLGDGVTVHEWTGFSVEQHGLVEVGPGAVLVGAGLWCAESISVGAGAVISYSVLITDSDMHPLDPDLRARDAEALTWRGSGTPRPPAPPARPVSIGEGAWIGIGAIVLKGSRIGAHARVAPGAVVAGEVPDGATVAGNPARPVEGAA